jgi:sporulation protein YlmC with PRC-barrel domain
MEIPVKAKVQCADGPGGEATHVIVHPSTNRVTRLVVKEARSPHVKKLVPFRFIQDFTGGQIRLNCSMQELARMQSFERTEVHESDTSSYGKPSFYAQSIYGSPRIKKVKRTNIPPDELTVDANTRVKATDGNAGRIDELMVDPANGSITHLLLRERRVWARKDLAVPISEVDRIGDRTVYLKTNRASIETLPAVAAPRR